MSEPIGSRQVIRSVVDSWATLRKYQSAVFDSVDFYAGVVACLVVLCLASFDETLVAEIGAEIAVAAAGIGVAAVGLALTALAIIVGLMSDSFALILKEASGDERDVFIPFQSVATVGGLAGVSAVIGLAVGDPLPHWCCVLGFSALAGLSVWALVGSIQLVGLTAFLGGKRLDHYERLVRARALGHPVGGPQESDS